MNSIEERFYEAAAKEVASRNVLPGVMAKAFVDAQGDEKKAIANYIRVRAKQMTKDWKDECKRQLKERPKPPCRLPNGGILFKCHHCKGEIETKNDEYKIVKCPHCGDFCGLPDNL